MQQTKELPACPVETTLMLIGDKWKVLILRDLMPGTKRFGELKKSIGSVSQKVLTAQLRDMEEKGLVNRQVDVYERQIQCRLRCDSIGTLFITEYKMGENKWKIRFLSWTIR